MCVYVSFAVSSSRSPTRDPDQTRQDQPQCDAPHRKWVDGWQRSLIAVYKYESWARWLAHNLVPSGCCVYRSKETMDARDAGAARRRIAMISGSRTARCCRGGNHHQHHHRLLIAIITIIIVIFFFSSSSRWCRTRQPGKQPQHRRSIARTWQPRRRD